MLKARSFYRKNRVEVLVVGCHLLVILFFLCGESSLFKDKKKLIVQNVVFKPSPRVREEPLLLEEPKKASVAPLKMEAPVAEPDTIASIPEPSRVKKLWPDPISFQPKIEASIEKKEKIKPLEVKRELPTLKGSKKKNFETKTELPTLRGTKIKKPAVKKELPSLKNASAYPPSNLLDQLEEAVLSLDSPPRVVSKKQRPPEKKNLHVPKAISSLHVDAMIEVEADGEASFLDNSSGSDYVGMFIQELKESLNLPEYGEVKVKMRMSSRGNVESVDVLSSRSKKNAAYLKNTLPQLTFPWLNEFLKNSSQTYTIIFKNE